MEFREVGDCERELVRPLPPPKAGTDRSRSRPREVTGDSAYDVKEVRAYLKRRGMKANIDVNPRNRRKPKRGRPYKSDREAYKSMRSAVERFFT
ncbi:transposase [Candidatus Bathyarchaeota archaeon]|nr:transposase [Candidatus Bathyarchaeota archaeon]MBS7618151.1 transposase [Candidatus Bathyarchaeota archaeon]